uniref:Uncharacterized protein n=1 Tax=Timema douglasi TaxID=61478 RepID=A0A7R8VE99_TIMDO|nr:unnamed protein product [Timema douglasi]
METPRKHQYRHSNICHVGLATLFKVTLKLLQTTSTLSKLVRNTFKNHLGYINQPQFTRSGSNPDLRVIGNLVYCKRGSLNHSTIKAGGVENVPSVIPDRDANPYVIGSTGYCDIGALPHGATKAVLNVLERLWGFRLFFLVRFWAKGNDGFDELLFCAWLSVADHHYSSDSNILESFFSASLRRALAAMLNTAVVTFSRSSRFFSSRGGGCALSAIKHVGVNASARQCARGNQYQYCVKMRTPTTASILQGHCDVTASRIDDSLRQNGSEFGHHILVFVYNHFGIQCAEIFYLGASVLSLLDKDHGGCNKGALTNKIDRIIGHGVQQGNGFFKACASTCDPQSHRSSVAYVGVVAFS